MTSPAAVWAAAQSVVPCTGVIATARTKYAAKTKVTTIVLNALPAQS
jgi:hypothetical protein